MSPGKQDCRCTCSVHEATEIFPSYLSIHFPFPCVLTMPAGTEGGKAGIASSSVH